VISAAHREPSECRADAFSSAWAGRGRQPAGPLVFSGMLRAIKLPVVRGPSSFAGKAIAIPPSFTLPLATGR